MPKDPIISSGRKGFGFEQKGFQERNLALLLETLSKKEVQKSIESLSKIEKDSWKSIADAATQLNEFVSLGGVSTLTSSVKTTIDLKIAEFLSPLTNEINQAISDIIAPFIADILTPMINDLNAYLAENTFGAGVGGIAGNILASFLPGGNIWVVVFSALGAFLEESIGKLMNGETGVDVWTTFADAVTDRIEALLKGDVVVIPRVPTTRPVGGFQEGF